MPALILQQAMPALVLIHLIPGLPAEEQQPSTYHELCHIQSLQVPRTLRYLPHRRALARPGGCPLTMSPRSGDGPRNACKAKGGARGSSGLRPQEDGHRPCALSQLLRRAQEPQAAVSLREKKAGHERAFTKTLSFPCNHIHSQKINLLPPC